MSTTDQVLSAFIDEWNAGRRPRVREYLNRVPEGPARDELAEQISTWLEIAPTPDYDDAARAAIRAEPVVEHVLSAVGDDAGLWPAVLPRLRARQGLSIAQVAASLVQRFGLRGADEPRTATYLERLERGDLAPARVSRRLLDALGELLGASPGTLADAGTYGRGLRPAASGGALFRASREAPPLFAADIEALSQAAMPARARADGRAGSPVHRRPGRLEQQAVDRAGHPGLDRCIAAQRRLQQAAVQGRRQVRQVADRSQAVGQRLEAQSRHRLMMEAFVDLAAQLLDPHVRGQPQLLEAEAHDDRAHAEVRGDDDDLVERRLAVDELLHPDPRDQELRRERVRLDLIGVGRAAADRRERVDLERPVVPAPDMAELVREREPLTRQPLRPVDPQHGGVAVAIARAGDVGGQPRHDDGEAGPLLDDAQQARQRRGGIEAERLPGLAGALGTAVVVEAAHSVPSKIGSTERPIEPGSRGV